MLQIYDDVLTYNYDLKPIIFEYRYNKTSDDDDVGESADGKVFAV